MAKKAGNSKSKSRLGRGLSSLISNSAAAPASRYQPEIRPEIGKTAAEIEIDSLREVTASAAGRVGNKYPV